MDAVKLMARALEYSSQGKYDRAISDYTRVLGHQPDNGLAVYSRGYCYYAQHDYERAIADFAEGERVAPNLLKEYALYICKAYVGRAEQRHSARQYDLAIEDYTDGLRFHEAPTGFPGYLQYLRGNSFLSKGDFPAAIMDYDKAIEFGYSGYGECVPKNRALATWALENRSKLTP